MLLPCIDTVNALQNVMHKTRLNSIFKKYIAQRNEKIIKLRRQGKSLKWLAWKFGLTNRHISRILK